MKHVRLLFRVATVLCFVGGYRSLAQTSRPGDVTFVGKLGTLAGNGTSGFSGDGGPATAAELGGFLSGTRKDAAGNLYICDAGNARIRKVDVNGTITTFAGNGTAGHSGDGGPATSATLNGPDGIVVDSHGNVYFSEFNNFDIRKVTPGGVISDFADLGTYATDLAIDVNDNLFVTEHASNQVYKFTPDGTKTLFAGNGTHGFAGDNGPATQAEFANPNNINVDPNGNVYIADADNNVVRKVDTEGTVTTFAGNRSTGYQGDGGPATSASFRTPSHPAFDKFGNVYIPDVGNAVIRVVDSSGTIQTFAGNATSAYSGDGGSALNGSLVSPGFANADSTGALYFTDNLVIRTLQPTTLLLLDTTQSSVTVQIQNTGGAALHFSSLTPSSPYAVTGGTCSTQNLLSIGAICTVVLSVSSGSLVAGTLTVHSDASNSTATLTLTTGSGPASQTITFPTIPQHVYGDPPFTLNATASSELPVSYNVVSGPATISSNTVTLTGTGSVTIQATQEGNSTYAAAPPVSQAFIVVPPAPVLTSITPAGILVGSAATTITLTGQNLSPSDTVLVNGTAVTSTLVSSTSLTAIIPVASLATAGTLQITVFDSANQQTTPAQTFAVAPTPSVSFSGPLTSPPAQQPAINVTLVNPYPTALSTRLTLTFAPASATLTDDPSVQFSTGGRSQTFTIPANSTVTPAIMVQSGTVEGTITVNLVLTSNGLNVTPSNVKPVVITIPPAVPAISATSLTRSSNSLTLSVQAYSNTRDVGTAVFHFTPAPGSTIATPDITADVNAVFAAWFASTPSQQYGSSFTYSQDFALSGDPSTIGSVTVTLVNTVGQSTMATAR